MPFGLTYKMGTEEMKFALLSGAYKNSGDYLIEQRAKSLLQFVYPDSEILVCLRSEIMQRVDEINSCDAVVLAGGPIFMRNLEKYLPLDVCMDDITPPISVLGGGWYGTGGGNNQIYGYRFTKKTARFLHKIDEQGGILSVRDWMTYELLQNQQFQNVVMTGCPAWYDPAYVHETELRSSGRIKKIVISDPADKCYYSSCMELVRFLRNKYADAVLTFAFHRGISSDEKTQKLLKELEQNEALVVDLSGSAEGFSVYKDCGLHIGYRVHAHIYCLSLRYRSLLIEEDGRGAGVDQALGLFGIHAYNDLFHFSSPVLSRLYKRTPLFSNRNLAAQARCCLEKLDQAGDEYFHHAFAMQTVFYENMISAIRSFGKEISISGGVR